jgi:hypothetical protein
MLAQPAVGASRRRTSERGDARTTSLVLGCFLVGVAVSAFWFYRSNHQDSGGPKGPSQNTLAPGLSDGTLGVLKRLDSPIEIRFYSLLDAPRTPESLKTFAERVEKLLLQYQEAAGGKIQLSRRTTLAGSNQDASTDGIRPIDVGGGEECFLGIAVVQGTHKESLPQLSPDWEPALQPDLSRAIARLLDASAPARPSQIRPRVDSVVIDEVKRVFPNLDAVTVEQGAEKLRDSALKEMQAVLAQTDAQIKEAEQRLTQAQSGGSEADKQAALKELQQAQAGQTEKLKQIAAHSAAQVEALKKLKSGGP